MSAVDESPARVDDRFGAGQETAWWSVRDSGGGLPGGTCGRVLRAFYTTKTEGIGIASISRSIVEAHGGRLWAARTSLMGRLRVLAFPGAQDRQS